MNDSKKITRRRMIQTTLGAAALAAGGRVVAGVPGITPAQVKGPFFPIHDQADKDTDLTRVEGRTERALGEVIDVIGQVLGEDGQPVSGALIDIWQANTYGRYNHEADPNPAPHDPNFQYWAKFMTDAEGHYRFRTIIPGAYPATEGWTRPPHIHFRIARRGYHELITQMYFAGNELNEIDRLLLDVPEEKRGKLIVEFATESMDPAAPPLGRFDIVLRKA